MSLSRSAHQERAKRIIEFFLRHDKDKKATLKHFAEEGVGKKCIYSVLKRHEIQGDVVYKKPTGRKLSVCTPEMFEKLSKLFKENPQITSKAAAEQLGVARTSIFRIMAKMREINMETNREVGEGRCPTCRQTIKSKKPLKKKERKVPKSPKKSKPKPDKKSSANQSKDPDNQL